MSFVRLRAFRRATWLRAILLTEARFVELEIPGKIRPFEDVQTVRFCGSTLGAWEAVVIRHGLEGRVVEDALRVYGARVDRGGPLDLGLRSSGQAPGQAPGQAGVSATRLRVATDVWTAVRREISPGELWLVAPDAARASVVDFADEASAGGLPAPPEGLAAVLELTQPRARISDSPQELAELTSLHVELRLLPEGGAELTGRAQADNAVAAREIARRIEERIARVADSVFVRVALRGVLSGFTARSSGTGIELRLPISPPQVDSVLSLLAAHLGARFDAPAGAGAVVAPASSAPPRAPTPPTPPSHRTWPKPDR